MNAVEFVKAKGKRKICMITCYDFWSAQIASRSLIDAFLVGDSASMVMHGEDSTINIDISTMTLHIKSVRKGAPKSFIIGDMPFLSYRKSMRENMISAEKLIKAGANAIKLEGALGNIEFIKHLVESGVPVMGHLGLTPQFINEFGSYRVSAKSKEAQKELVKQCLNLEQAGCFSIVLECVPRVVGKEVTQKLKIPTIGIGAGVDTDGQILVMQDMLGMSPNSNPKFLRKYLDGENLILEAFNNYCKDVVREDFPSHEESYS